MIATHGLTHISLAVKDPERSLAFCNLDPDGYEIEIRFE